MTDLTRARELLALAKELDRLLAEQIAAMEAAEARTYEALQRVDAITGSREIWRRTAEGLTVEIDEGRAKLASAEKVIDRARVLARVVQDWLRVGRIASALPGRTLERHSELDRFVDALAAHDASAPKEGE